MNERIREIADQAWKCAEHPIIPKDFDIGIFEKKFAELIVQECANQCTTEGPFVAEVVWGKQFHKKILEHFGVDG